MTKKQSEITLDPQDKKMIERQDLSLYKRFGYPEIREIGLWETKGYGALKAMEDILSIASMGHIYSVNLNKLSKSEGMGLEGHNGFVLFTRKDIEKLLQFGVGAVELVLSTDNQLLIINHGFHYHVDLQE